jgi:hypothetical protein
MIRPIAGAPTPIAPHNRIKVEVTARAFDRADSQP